MGQNFTNTTFDAEAEPLISTSASAPFTGTFRPEGDLTQLYGSIAQRYLALEDNRQWPHLDTGEVQVIC